MYLKWFHCSRLFTRAIYLQPWLRDVHTLLPSRVKLGAACVVFPLSSHCIWQISGHTQTDAEHQTSLKIFTPFQQQFDSCFLSHHPSKGFFRPEEFHLEKPNFSKETSVKPSTSRDTKPANPFMDAGDPWIETSMVETSTVLVCCLYPLEGTPHLSQWFESQVCQLANPCWIITKLQA